MGSTKSFWAESAARSDIGVGQPAGNMLKK